MSEDIPLKYLHPLLTDSHQKSREAVKRRKPFDYQTIPESELEELQKQGWAKDRVLSKRIRIKRPIQIDQKLENRFWMLLFKLGYPELNQGRSFSILLERKGAESLKKQIDVFAKDEETVIVAECKASDKMGKRSLQKDVEEFANLKGLIAQSVQKHYGVGFKPKIIWFFVTENIIWSKPDKERAIGERIRVVTERELRYYTQIAEHLGKAARYQFLAEFLKDQEIPGLQNVQVSAVRGKLGGHKFYSFVSRPRDILKISFVNHRSLNDPEGAPTYQRLVNRTRIREIGKFVKAGGFFPTNILINFTRNVRFDKIAKDEKADVTFGTLYLPEKYRSAWIIDGQHRLYGFSTIDDSYLDKNIIVVAFEKMSTAEEAQLFVTINHEQRSVPKHLLEDLEGELKWGSSVPAERVGSIASRLINNLNTDVGYPFANRVTQQGIPSTNKTCLTIPAIKEALRRSNLIGHAVFNGKNYEPGPLCGPTDLETLEKSRSALESYFERIRDANPSQWEMGRAGFLCTNVAVQGYIMLLASLIKYWESNNATDPKEMEADEIIMELEEYLQPVLNFLSKATDEIMEKTFKVPFGSGGPPEYYFRLCRIIKAQFADFEPEGMDKWQAEQSEENISAADRKIKEIVVKVQKRLFDVLRKLYGEQKDAYWHKGISDKSIKTKAYDRSLDYDDEGRLPLENYLDVVDFKKIIESKQNWPFLRDVFDIPEPGEKGLAKNLNWLDRINELRRISAHPSKERGYKLDDFAYIDLIHEQLEDRLANAKEIAPLKIAALPSSIA
jgi:DNA sulfur modification protein DndB